MKIYLASQSPRRQDLLKQMGVEFQVLPIDIQETTLPHESSMDYSKRITHEKLVAARQFIDEHELPKRPILCADTEVVMSGKIYGKPKNVMDAFQMLKSYSLQKHQVMTSVGIHFLDIEKIEIDVTDVYFSELTDDVIENYLAMNQYQDKAGAYGIQGYMGQYIEKIEGSFYAVMGLPIHRVRRLLDNLNDTQ